MKNSHLILSILVLALGLVSLPAAAQSGQAQLSLLDRKNQSLAVAQDGNALRMRLDLPQAAAAEQAVTFHLDGIASPVGDCTIAKGSKSCQTDLAPAYGWYWNEIGQPQAKRVLTAQSGGAVLAQAAFSVKPRPVVMVHGFNANYHTFDRYLNTGNLLEPYGLHGYAIGDGQVEGVMQTGSIIRPLERTNTIAQNAEILAQYIANVRQVTGAEQVDLLVHSMGGMISRYYLDRLMTEREVAQLIILGTPMAGSACAMLPASLGMILPATIEIQPAYMDGIFNPQILDRKGVPFHALAGTILQDPVQSPCTPAPSDLVVSLDSVRAIAMPVQEIALLHTDLNASEEVFEQFVLPHLSTPPSGMWTDDKSSRETPAGPGKTQYSQTFIGHLDPGESADVVIPIDAGVLVANFSLYDTSRSLITEVTGASGKVITLDPVKNGVIQVNDPASLFYLGYGFSQPKPGRWVIKLLTTDQTPPSGADYAIMAQFQGGAVLTLNLDKLLPEPGETVTLKAELEKDDVPLALNTARVTLHLPDGSTEVLSPTVAGNTATIQLKPDQPGLYMLEMAVSALAEDGQTVERAGVGIFQVQLSRSQVSLYQVLFAGALVLALAGFIFWRRRRRKKA